MKLERLGEKIRSESFRENLKAILVCYLITAFIVFLNGCASGGGSGNSKRNILDESNERPNWVNKAKVNWVEGDNIFFKGTSTVKGGERLDACYTLAKLEVKTTLLSEISEDIKGALDNAQTSISENAEIILSQVRSGKFEGRVSGLRIEEEYFQRYELKGEERLECMVSSRISQNDYNKLRSQILNKTAEVDPRIKEAILKKQVSFFEEDSVRREKAEVSPKEVEKVSQSLPVKVIEEKNEGESL